MTIGDEIVKMIEEAKPVSVSNRESDNLCVDLGFDSLFLVCFLLKIEKAYSINFDIVEMEAFLHLVGLIRLVEKKVKEREEKND